MYFKTQVELRSPLFAGYPERLLAQWAAEHAAYYAKYPFLMPSGAYAGYEEVQGGGTWRTCRGNWHSLRRDGPVWTVEFDGRRHGMREDFRDFLREFRSQVLLNLAEYRTQEPDWAPWETASSRVPAWVREALRLAGNRDHPTRWDPDAGRVYLRPDSDLREPYTLAVRPPQVVS